MNKTKPPPPPAQQSQSKDPPMFDLPVLTMLLFRLLDLHAMLA